MCMWIQNYVNQVRQTCGVMLKWKLSFNLKIVIWFLLLNLSGIGGTVLAGKFSGDFPTAHIRELWQICSMTYQYKQPQLNQMTRWMICDCYTDTIRKDLSPDKVKNMEYEEAKKLSAKLISQCNVKLKNETYTWLGLFSDNLQVAYLMR